MEPLRFHEVHGKGVVLDNDRAIARRSDTSRINGGVAFSSRPIAVDERVYVKLLHDDNVAIRFGFTSQDPSEMTDNDRVSDLWIKSLEERYAEPGSVLCFHVSAEGDVFVEVNGVCRGAVIHRVATERPLWAIVDVLGENSAAVELVSAEDATRPRAGPTLREVVSSREVALPSWKQSPRNKLRDLYSSCRNSNKQQPALSFHRVHGKNVVLNGDKTMAWRDEGFRHGVTFTSRAIAVGERIHLKLLDVNRRFRGGINLGFIGHDPALLENDVPCRVCPYLTRIRGCCWAKEVPESLARLHGVLSFRVDSAGCVRLAVDGEDAGEIFTGVEVTRKLWAVVELYGNSSAVEIVNYYRLPEVDS